MDLGRADRIKGAPDARLYRPSPAVKLQTFSTRRIEALSIYRQATGLPCEYPHRPVRSRQYPWMECIPHAITPEGLVYADLYDTRAVHR